jgi:hypothetical protein
MKEITKSNLKIPRDLMLLTSDYKTGGRLFLTFETKPISVKRKDPNHINYFDYCNVNHSIYGVIDIEHKQPRTASPTVGAFH